MSNSLIPNNDIAETEEIEFINSQRGGSVLVHNNFMYNKDKIQEGNTRWRCMNRACKGVVYLDENNSIVKTVEHSHSPVPDKIRKRKALNRIKERLMNTSENAVDIIVDHLPVLSESENIALMPSIDYIRDTIRRERNIHIGHIPGKIIDIPDMLKHDKLGNPFLRYDSGFEDNERIIIFFSSFKQKYLGKIETFVIDGTFKSSPSGFYQVVILHGYIFGKTFPFMYILLSNKTENSYFRAFEKCKELGTLNIKFIVTDLERALINALRKSFPEAEYHGCLFHLSQAAWKRIGYLGDIKVYKENELYKKAVKMMLCLVFVPKQDVPAFYEDIKDFIIKNDLQVVNNCGVPGTPLCKTRPYKRKKK
jgi:hypothetical protein